VSLPILVVLLIAISSYWVMTQILPERKRASLQRPGIAEGLLSRINDRRRAERLPVLELDEDLAMVAENKATHQVLTGRSDEGWEYPDEYAGMLGRSLVMEALFEGRVATLEDRVVRQRDLLDDEWVRCGIGVASSAPGEAVVALVLCREAWGPAGQSAAHRSLVERLVLGD
jgi:hypothetical protein